MWSEEGSEPAQAEQLRPLLPTLWGKTSRMRALTGGRKQSDPIFSFLWSRGFPSWTHTEGDHQSLRRGQKEEPPAHSISCQPPRHLCTGIHLGWEMHTCPPWRTLESDQMWAQTRQLVRDNPGDCPHISDLKHLYRVQLTLSRLECSSTGSLLPINTLCASQSLCWIFLQGRQGPRSCFQLLCPWKSGGTSRVAILVLSHQPLAFFPSITLLCFIIFPSWLSTHHSHST